MHKITELRAQPGFWRDPRNAELADQLVEQAEMIRAKAGPRTGISQIMRSLTEGMDEDDAPPSA